MGKNGRKVYYNACSHHIYELIQAAGWKATFGKTTTDPENISFNKFKIQWDTIDKSKPFKS